MGRLDLEPDAVLKFIPKERMFPAEPDDSTDECVPSQQQEDSTDDDDGSGESPPEDGARQPRQDRRRSGMLRRESPSPLSVTPRAPDWSGASKLARGRDVRSRRRCTYRDLYG